MILTRPNTRAKQGHKYIHYNPTWRYARIWLANIWWSYCSFRKASTDVFILPPPEGAQYSWVLAPARPCVSQGCCNNQVTSYTRLPAPLTTTLMSHTTASALPATWTYVIRSGRPNVLPTPALCIQYVYKSSVNYAISLYVPQIRKCTALPYNKTRINNIMEGQLAYTRQLLFTPSHY